MESFPILMVGNISCDKCSDKHKLLIKRWQIASVKFNEKKTRRNTEQIPTPDTKNSSESTNELCCEFRLNIISRTGNFTDDSFDLFECLQSDPFPILCRNCVDDAIE